MKKFLFFLAVTACLVTTGCSDEYDDSVLTERIEALENRMKELEELCKRLNENDYITSVEPVIENRKTVGYELSFGKSDPITIYHGKDGADSAITEVTQDEQNVYLTLQDGTVITLPKKESSGGSGDGDNSGEGSDSGDDGDNGDGGEEADPTKASVEVPKAGGLDLALEDADLLRIETLRVSGFLNDDDIRFIYRNLPRVACLDLSQAKMEVWESAIFDEKTSLKHISLPQVAEVMSMACYGCSALEEVVIPEGTTKIGGQAFYECRALTDVYCRAGVPPLLGIQVFEGTSIKNLYVPEGSADAAGTGTNIDAQTFRLDIFSGSKACILHRLYCCRDSILGKQVGLSDLCFFDVLGRLKVLDLGRYLDLLVAGVKAGNHSNAVFARNQTVPKVFNIISNRRDHTHAGDYYSIHPCRCTECRAEKDPLRL